MTEEKIVESPDKDKTLELDKDKPPNMGEGEDLPEGKEGEVTLPPDTGEGGEGTLDPETLALLKKKGFKDPAELTRAYEAQEKKQTELEKDARLRSLTTEVPERPRIERTFTEVPALTKDPYDMSKEEFEDYQGKREKRFEEKITAKYEDAEADKKWDREYRETMAVVNKDPERFEALKPTLATLHRKYPEASMSAIYPVADEMEKAQSKKSQEKFLRDTFGPDADVDKLKTLVSKVRVPVISGAGGTGAEKVNKTDVQKKKDAIWGVIAESDMRRD